jgi:hypothetical protein
LVEALNEARAGHEVGAGKRDIEFSGQQRSVLSHPALLTAQV